jgi:hypothetical protein
MYDVRVERGVRIPTGEPGVTLAADLFLPVGAGPVPALVTLTPYRRDALGGVGTYDTARAFAAGGYAGVLVDLRGTGSSDGDLRPPFDPGEGDDGVAAVEWAAAQPWCDGAVGMWGFSYSAALTLRTAARRPPALRAIIPLMGLADGERDFVHPDGVRGCLGPLGVWTLGTVLDLLLPPLADGADPVEQARWRRRVEHADPYLLDLCAHGPGHEVWRSRVIDVAAVRAPALCVTGWRDVFCGGAFRAYEDLGGPKKLLVGAWSHSMPHEALDAPVDFPALALRWWDRWLSGLHNGVDDEPPVTAYVQGDEPGWRHFASWPPPAKAERYAAVDGELGPPRDGAPPGPVHADPTAGAHAGLWGVPTGRHGQPLDQHEDDLVSLAVTSRPLERPLLVLGRPVVTVGADAPRRLVVRLADVDPRGRSTMITGGLLANSPDGRQAVVALDPTCYRVPAGHRIRVTVAEGAFPRLWPSTTGTALTLDRLSLTVPVASATEGQPAELPPPAERGGALWLRDRPRWELRRDPGRHGVTVVTGGSFVCTDPGGVHVIELDSSLSASARRAEPGAASLRGGATTTVHMGSGERVVVRVDLHATAGATTVSGVVTVDGAVIAQRRWHA